MLSLKFPQVKDLEGSSLMKPDLSRRGSDFPLGLQAPISPLWLQPSCLDLHGSKRFLICIMNNGPVLSRALLRKAVAWEVANTRNFSIGFCFVFVLFLLFKMSKEKNK